VLEGIPTSEQVKNIVSLIKAKHGGEIRYGGETGDQAIYRRWREMMYPRSIMHG